MANERRHNALAQLSVSAGVRKDESAMAGCNRRSRCVGDHDYGQR